jgi:hypothetical protein
MWYGRGASRHDKERVERVEVEVALVVEDHWMMIFTLNMRPGKVPA